MSSKPSKTRWLKYFNDEFGHSCGDEVLKYTADSIKEVTFERGFSGRFGGDEFVICLTDFADKNMAGEAILATACVFLRESDRVVAGRILGDAGNYCAF